MPRSACWDLPGLTLSSCLAHSPLPRSHAAALIGRGPLEGAPLWNP